MKKPPYKMLPSTADSWNSTVEPAKDAYWEARKNGSNENSALLAALDVLWERIEDQQ